MKRKVWLCSSRPESLCAGGHNSGSIANTQPCAFQVRETHIPVSPGHTKQRHCAPGMAHRENHPSRATGSPTPPGRRGICNQGARAGPYFLGISRLSQGLTVCPAVGSMADSQCNTLLPAPCRDWDFAAELEHCHGVLLQVFLQGPGPGGLDPLPQPCQPACVLLEQPAWAS